jgi:flagellar biosynthesis chaperone FliJ
MNITEVRSIIRQVIAEAMEDKKNGLPKSGGKLVHLKKELQSLKGMREALGQYQIAEGGEETPGFVAEYAHMQKFVNELEKIKAAHSKLAEMLDNQISEVEGKVSSETEKVKEMMGLIEKAKKEPKEKKAHKGAAKSKHEKGETKEEEKEEHKPKVDDKKKVTNKTPQKEAMGAKNFTYKDITGKTKFVTADNLDQAKEKVKKFNSKIDLNTIKEQ